MYQGKRLQRSKDNDDRLDLRERMKDKRKKRADEGTGTLETLMVIIIIIRGSRSVSSPFLLCHCSQGKCIIKSMRKQWRDHASQEQREAINQETFFLSLPVFSSLDLFSFLPERMRQRMRENDMT